MPRAQIILADAQFGVDRFMRPNADFTDLYDGTAVADNPVYLYPNGVPRDKQAGEPGYDPDLVRGLSVPLGARIVMQLPIIGYIESTPDPTVVRSYIWSFFWRERNLFDYRTQRIPWHLPQGRGPDDASVAPPSPRVTLFVSSNTIIYNQPEPASATLPDALRAVQNGRADDLRMAAVTVPGPLLPDGSRGVVQQGVLDPATFPTDAPRQLFMRYETQAAGDELIIAVRRDTGPANWEFGVGGADRSLGEVFGQIGRGAGGATERVGVYVKTGTAPGGPDQPRATISP